MRVHYQFCEFSLVGTLKRSPIKHLKIGHPFHSSAEVYNRCIGPVYDRKDEDSNGENYFLGNLQTSHQLASFPHIIKGFFRPTLTDVSGKKIRVCQVHMRTKSQRPVMTDKIHMTG